MTGRGPASSWHRVRSPFPPRLPVPSGYEYVGDPKRFPHAGKPDHRGALVEYLTLQSTSLVAGVGCTMRSGRGSRLDYTRPLLSLRRAAGIMPLAGAPLCSSPAVGGRRYLCLLDAYIAWPDLWVLLTFSLQFLGSDHGVSASLRHNVCFLRRGSTRRLLSGVGRCRGGPWVEAHPRAPGSIATCTS